MLKKSWNASNKGDTAGVHLIMNTVHLQKWLILLLMIFLRVSFKICFAAAVTNSGVDGANEKEVTKVMSAIADRVVHEFVEPFTFPNQHRRILEPYNYYEFGQVMIPFKTMFIHTGMNYEFCPC